LEPGHHDSNVHTDQVAQGMKLRDIDAKHRQDAEEADRHSLVIDFWLCPHTMYEQQISCGMRQVVHIFRTSGSLMIATDNAVSAIGFAVLHSVLSVQNLEYRVDHTSWPECTMPFGMVIVRYDNGHDAPGVELLEVEEKGGRHMKATVLMRSAETRSVAMPALATKLPLWFTNALSTQYKIIQR